jgi:hypothetical protein
VEKWKLSVNVGKCEAAFFSTDDNETSWRPSLAFDGQLLPYNEAPTFLGVKFDRKLTFKAHTANFKNRMQSRNNIMKALSGRDWGLQKEDLRVLFKVCIGAVATYCAPAYLANAASTYRNQLQIAQNAGARVITGCTKDTPTDLLNNEAGLLPIDQYMALATACALDRALRLPEDNPTQGTAKSSSKRRLKTQNSWREMGRDTLRHYELLDIEREQLIPTGASPPWGAGQAIVINDDLNTATKNTDIRSKKYNAAISTIDSLGPANVRIWTHGSAVDSTTNGGSGVVVDSADIDDLVELKIPAGKI